MTGLRGTVAVLIPGCAAETPDGVAMPSAIGPLMEAIAERTDRVVVVAYEPPRDARDEHETDFVARRRRNISVVSLGPPGSWRDYRERRRRVRAIVERESPQWDVAWWRVPNRRLELVWSASRCQRNIATIHGHAPSVARALPRGRVRLRQRADAIRTERTAREVIGASRVVVANSPMLISAYRHSAPNAHLSPLSMLRTEDLSGPRRRLEGHDPTFAICSRITLTKGVFEAVDAFAVIKQRIYPGARLIVIGDGDGLDALKDRVGTHQLNAVTTFTGWVPAGAELFRLFHDVDVLLHLSHAESFPCVVWEAMGNSVLVVSTDVGGLPELLTDRREVMFVGVRRPDQAVEAVRVLADDPRLRQTMCEEAFARSKHSTVEHFVNSMVSEISQAWPELARHGGPLVS